MQLKKVVLFLIACFITSVQAGIPASPGKRVWTLAAEALAKMCTVQSKVCDLQSAIEEDFAGTFTVYDLILEKACNNQTLAENIDSIFDELEIELPETISKLCAIESKLVPLESSVEHIDSINDGIFTELDNLNTTLCSKIEQVSDELVQVQGTIDDITQTEIDHTQTILSKLDHLDDQVIDLNSALEDISIKVEVNDVDSCTDVLVSLVDDLVVDICNLETDIENGFSGTFTALDAQLSKSDDLVSLVDIADPVPMVDFSGVFTSLDALEEKVCTMESLVDIVCLVNTNELLCSAGSKIDIALNKICTAESVIDPLTSIADAVISKLDEVDMVQIQDVCSNIEEAISKLGPIESKIDLINDEVDAWPVQENFSQLENIETELLTICSKLDQVDITDSKLCVVDSKVDAELIQATTICSLIDDIIDQELTIDSKVDLIDQNMQIIESKVCEIEEDTFTICSNLDELINTFSTVESKLDNLIVTNAGQLCTDFGNTGTVTTGFAPLSVDEANAVAVQTDGKIVVVGQTNAVSGFDFALARYLANGSLDVSFGIGGLVTTDISTLGIDNAFGVAIQANGKIVVVGETTLAGTTSIVLARYNVDGSLDASFNGTGIVITPPLGLNTVSLANAIRIQADGKIVIAGGTGLAAATDFLLARYNVDGSLDATFGVAGIATIDLGGVDIAHALLIQADGRIVAVGVSGASFAVARLTTAGVLDLTFGGGSGIVLTSIGSLAVANAALLQADGKIIVAGYSDLLGSNNFALTRYNIDGSLDLSFGLLGTGIVVQSFIGVSITIAHAAQLQADGKIILIGSNDIGGAISFSLARFNSNGTIDTAFGANGQVSTAFSAGISIDMANAAALTPDDQLIAVGQTNESGTFDFALACYELDTSSIFLIEQKASEICEKLELVSTSSINSKLDIIESLVCTIESNMDIVGSLIGEANMKAIDLEGDFASTWTILDAIENKLCTSESILEIVDSKIDNIDPLDLTGVFTEIDAILLKECTIDSKTDVANSLADILVESQSSIDFTGIFTALDALESKVCLIDDVAQMVSAGVLQIKNALGIPIFNVDLPLTINVSGRYYFAEPLVYNPDGTGTNAITIATSDVLIDGNGYDLTQQGGQAGTANTSGIIANGDLSNIIIESGSIHDLTGDGLSFATSCSVILVHNMNISQIGTAGDNGILCNNCNFVLIADCVVSAVESTCISLESSQNIVLHNCICDGETVSSEGIKLDRCSNICLEECICSNNDVGLNVINSINGVIISSKFDTNLLDGASISTPQAAYVVNFLNDSVSVIDVAASTEVSTIPIGNGGVQIAFTPDGRTAFVTNSTDDNVSVIDIATSAEISTIPVGDSPRGIACTSDGKIVYVTNRFGNTVSVVNVRTSSVIATIGVGDQPFGVVFTPDGTTAYVANAEDDTVSVIDVATNTVSTTIAVGLRPRNLSITPDGTTIYTSNDSGDNVSVIDVATNTVSTTIPVGERPSGIGFTPDSATAYVANFIDNNVSVIDVATNTVSTTISVGIGPGGVAVSPDGTVVYVTNQNDDDVSVIDVATNTVSTDISVGTSPSGVAFAPPGRNISFRDCSFIDNMQHGVNLKDNVLASIIQQCSFMGNQLAGLQAESFNGYFAMNTFIENTSNIDEVLTSSANTYLGNFCFNSTASGDPDNTNYNIDGESDITGKFSTVSQTSSFVDRPTKWKNINMLP